MVVELNVADVIEDESVVTEVLVEPKDVVKLIVTEIVDDCRTVSVEVLVELEVVVELIVTDVFTNVEVLVEVVNDGEYVVEVKVELVLVRLVVLIGLKVAEVVKDQDNIVVEVIVA